MFSTTVAGLSCLLFSKIMTWLIKKLEIFNCVCLVQPGNFLVSVEKALMKLIVATESRH